ncbi:MAG: D-sedoheptulose 7-phosphate isomerase [Cytophagales bacterium]|nr:D-sedoheptulose 7-phosphate isomerase [Cytophagales bacterium]
MNEFDHLVEAELRQSAAVLDDFLSNPHSIHQISKAAELMARAMEQGGKVLSCGNGGSHCDAMHFAEELTGRYRHSRRALPALAISDVSHISCTANDFGFDHVFARYVEALGRPGDVLLAISTSGNSANVLRAATAAREQGLAVVALTGKDGGKLGPLADVEIRVEHQGYADRVQEIHIKVIHILILLIEKQLTPDAG